jgi:hypothetical protein
VSLEGRGFLLALQILCHPIDESLSQSVRDLGEEGTVVVEKQCVDGDEGEVTSDDPSECCPPGLRV